jgi:hypothetical protein
MGGVADSSRNRLSDTLYVARNRGRIDIVAF